MAKYVLLDDEQVAPKGYVLLPDEPSVVDAGKMLNDFPRQVGLTARHALTGGAEALQIVTEPIRYITDRVTGSVGKTKPLGAAASDAADWIGLPKPQNETERVVGEGARLGFGTMLGNGLISKLAGPASNLPQFTGKNTLPVQQGVAGNVARSMAANPSQQVAAATGAGAASASSKEAGGNPWQQTVSGVIGGVAGGMVPNAVNTVANGAKNIASRVANANMTPQQMDARVSVVLQNSGIDFSGMSERVKQSVRADLASALKTNQDLDPDAVARLVAFRATGLTPTRGMLTQDPVQITKEMNLAKIAANTSDGELHGLPRILNQNNAKLIRNLNEAGANRGDVLRAGEAVTSTILGRQAGLRNAEQAAWDAAKSSPGYRQPISAGVLSDVNAALDTEGLMPFMNPTIGKYIGAFQQGHPFTPQDYRNLQSMLSREMAKGGNEGAAAGLARRVLEQANLRPAGFADTNNSLVTQGMASAMRGVDDAAEEAISAVNQARQATRRAYAYEDSSPLVRSVLSEGASSDPQRIAQRFVIGGTANEAEDLVRQLGPQGVAPIKDAILGHLKTKALSGATDETGKFSQSAFNKELNAIGERKLSILFTPEEIANLRQNGRVAALMQSQPVGSAVNNSNSGALVVGKAYDALKGGLGVIPGFGPVTAGILDVTLGNPVKNASRFIDERNAVNIMPGLLARGAAKPSLYRTGVLPGAAIGGLLAAPSVD